MNPTLSSTVIAKVHEAKRTESFFQLSDLPILLQFLHFLSIILSKNHIMAEGGGGSVNQISLNTNDKNWGILDYLETIWEFDCTDEDLSIVRSSFEPNEDPTSSTTGSLERVYVANCTFDNNTQLIDDVYVFCSGSVANSQIASNYVPLQHRIELGQSATVKIASNVVQFVP